MLVYRIAKWRYLNDLTGQGAKLYGGRWNREGIPALYSSSHLSLAVLELLANQIRQLVDESYGYIAISIPDSIQAEKVTVEELSQSWRRSEYDESTVDIGSFWLRSESSLLLSVPSAVLKQEINFIINPMHKEFKKLKIVEQSKLELDGRIYNAEQSIAKKDISLADE